MSSTSWLNSDKGVPGFSRGIQSFSESGKFIPFLVLVNTFLDEPSLVLFLVCFQCLFIEIQHRCVNSFLYFSVLRENKKQFYDDLRFR